ncbi:MAG: hypothetical protein AAF492_18810, partial [Verrucomicrobiota bacterium]
EDANGNAAPLLFDQVSMGICYTTPNCQGPRTAFMSMTNAPGWTFQTGEPPGTGAVDDSDDLYAIFSGANQAPLLLTDLGFNIPAGSVVSGIIVEVEGHGFTNCVGPLPPASAYRFRVALTKDGTNIAGLVQNLNFPPCQGDTERIAGGSTWMWGTTWTESELNASTFGVVLSDANNSTEPLRFDQVKVTVCYAPPAVPPVSKPYDVLYFDRSWFSDTTTNHWRLLQVVTNDHLVDTGQVSGIGPRDLGIGWLPEMRFYRVAPNNKWQAGQPQRIASIEVYVAKPIHLYPGQNWVAFPGWPDTPTPAWMFGHRLPGGPVIGSNTTMISWYNRTTNTSVVTTNTIYLQKFGGSANWMFAPPLSGVADNVRIPIEQGCVIQLPSNSPPRSILFVGRVPTNSNSRWVAGKANGPWHHTLIGGLNQPLKYGPSHLNLQPTGLINNPNGFQGGAFPLPTGPFSVDFMWVWNREQQRVDPGKLIWYSQGGLAGTGWRFAKPGYPEVPNTFFSSCDAILIQRGERTGQSQVATL